MHKHIIHIIEVCSKHLQAVYNDKYDAYYCPVCLKWSEDKCGDPNCNFCKKRPKTPSKEKS